jgi:hypothetical protein
MSNYTVTFKVRDDYNLKDGAVSLESELYDLLLRVTAPALGVEIEGVMVRKARG